MAGAWKGTSSSDARQAAARRRDTAALIETGERVAVMTLTDRRPGGSVGRENTRGEITVAAVADNGHNDRVLELCGKFERRRQGTAG